MRHKIRMRRPPIPAGLLVLDAGPFVQEFLRAVESLEGVFGAHSQVVLALLRDGEFIGRRRKFVRRLGIPG